MLMELFDIKSCLIIISSESPQGTNGLILKVMQTGTIFQGLLQNHNSKLFFESRAYQEQSLLFSIISNLRTRTFPLPFLGIQTKVI